MSSFGMGPPFLLSLSKTKKKERGAYYLLAALEENFGIS
jgi:hypothetical protein